MKLLVPFIKERIQELDSEKNMEFLLSKIGDGSFKDLYIETSYTSSLNGGFYGRDHKHVFKLAIMDLKDFCLRLITNLTNKSPFALHSFDPSQISIKIYYRNYGNMNRNYFSAYQETYQEYDYEEGRHVNYTRQYVHQIIVTRP